MFSAVECTLIYVYLQGRLPKYFLVPNRELADQLRGKENTADKENTAGKAKEKKVIDIRQWEPRYRVDIERLPEEAIVTRYVSFRNGNRVIVRAK